MFDSKKIFCDLFLLNLQLLHDHCYDCLSKFSFIEKPAASSNKKFYFHAGMLGKKKLTIDINMKRWNSSSSWILNFENIHTILLIKILVTHLYAPDERNREKKLRG